MLVVSEQTLIVMCGLPGSGKSFYANIYAENKDDYELISTDAIRKELLGDENDQSDGWLIFMTAYSRINSILSCGKSAIFDATNITHKNRRKVIKYYRSTFPEIKLICICMKTPVDICIERDSNRERVVGKDRIESMSRRFIYPVKEEGWDGVIFIEEL